MKNSYTVDTFAGFSKYRDVFLKHLKFCFLPNKITTTFYVLHIWMASSKKSQSSYQDMTHCKVQKLYTYMYVYIYSSLHTKTCHVRLTKDSVCVRTLTRKPLHIFGCIHDDLSSCSTILPHNAESGHNFIIYDVIFTTASRRLILLSGKIPSDCSTALK